MIQKYNSKLQNDWDNFVEIESENGTIFHLQKFLSYHPKERFKDCSVLVRNSKEKIIAVFPAALYKTFIVSHPGSTYGGIVIKKYLKLKEIKGIWKEIVEYYQNTYLNYGFKIILSENFFQSNDKLSIFFLNSGMNLDSKEISVVIDIPEFLKLKQLRKSTKTAIQSQRYLKIENIEYKIATTLDEKKEAYYILCKNLEEKYHKQPTHTFEELQKIELNLKNKIFYFIIKKHNKVVATYICFLLNKTVMHTFYIAKNESRGNYEDIGLICFICDFLNKNDIKYLNFGISSRGKEIKYWIHDYKEQFSKLFLTRDIWICENIDDLEIKYDA
jgi:hypothetical protein